MYTSTQTQGDQIFSGWSDLFDTWMGGGSADPWGSPNPPIDWFQIFYPYLLPGMGGEGMPTPPPPESVLPIPGESTPPTPSTPPSEPAPPAPTENPAQPPEIQTTWNFPTNPQESPWWVGPVAAAGAIGAGTVLGMPNPGPTYNVTGWGTPPNTPIEPVPSELNPGLTLTTPIEPVPSELTPGLPPWMMNFLAPTPGIPTEPINKSLWNNWSPYPGGTPPTTSTTWPAVPLPGPTEGPWIQPMFPGINPSIIGAPLVSTPPATPANPATPQVPTAVGGGSGAPGPGLLAPVVGDPNAKQSLFQGAYKPQDIQNFSQILAAIMMGGQQNG